MRTLLILAFMSVAIIGCQRVITEHSPVLTESAVVVSTVYTPARHDTEVGLTAVKTGPVGVDYGGNMGIRVGGGLQISDVTVPEKFAVVLRCRHGEFIIERPAIYRRFHGHEGDTVTVSYREVYTTVIDKRGDTTRVVKRSLSDYDFLDAELRH